MTWSRYGKGGWNNLGPMIAMMAASAADDWNDDIERRVRHNERKWKDSNRGRQRRGRMFGSGELRLALLVLIAEEPRHGYELIKAIEDLTGGSYAPSPGAVYPTLQMLADEGMIEEAKSKDAKKPFKVTEEGEAELNERKDEVMELMGRLAQIGKRAEKAQVKSPDLFRAMGNLASVLKNRAKAGKLDQDVMNEIVDIIDEVAKRIERL